MRTFLLSVVFHLLLCGDRETNDFALQRYIERDDSVADDFDIYHLSIKAGAVTVIFMSVTEV